MATCRRVCKSLEEGGMNRLRPGSRENHFKNVDDPASLDDPSVGQRKSVGMDRRSLNNRRLAYNLNYFADSGVERRKWKERRRELVEPRKAWVRVTDWTSAMVGFQRQPGFSDRIYNIE